MPELPEVELLKRGLSHYLVGLTIAEVEVRTPKIFTGESSQIVGSKVSGIRRFGKMLSIDLANKMSMAVHVKMTGQLIYRGKKQPKKIDVTADLTKFPNKHTHLIFTFKNGDKLYYNDLRKFGWIKIVPTDEVLKLPFVSKLGPEPFRDLALTQFVEILSKYSRPIKALLMDQERISGVGNIYANEAVFCAGISPYKKSNRLDRNSVRRLYDCIIKVLKDGIKYGGSSLDAFRNVLGQKGEYQKHFLSYGREGEPCLRNGCSGTVKKVRLGGRGTYYCPRCQK